MFKVIAQDKPEQLGGTYTQIGELNVVTAPRTSKWGDENIFFRHQILDHDVKVKPEWAQYHEQGLSYPFLQNLEAKQTPGCPFLQ